MRRDMRLTPATVLTLQEAAESFLVRLFEDTNLCANKCQESYDYAEGHEAGLENLGRYKSWMELDECVNNCVYKC